MEVHVIGAGPAGTISALSSLRNGFNVIVSEEHPEAGIPENCSGLISKTGLESLKEFIDYKKFILNEFNGAVIDFSGIEFQVENEKTVAYAINRSGFDKELALNAEKEGAKINYNERVNGNFYSENIIGADGPLSHTASKFNFPKIEKFVLCAQNTVKYSVEDKKKVRLFYSNELFPGFFGWIIPKNEDYIEIGCGSVLPNNPKKGFEYLLKKFNIENNENSYSIIPIKNRSMTGIKKENKNIILVGDAAGQTKATTGGGIVFGGNCAKIAGEFAGNAYGYENEWRSRCGFDLNAHSLIQNFLENRSEEGLRRVGNFLNSAKLDEYLSSNGNMDKPSRMINFNLIAHFIRNLF